MNESKLEWKDYIKTCVRDFFIIFFGIMIPFGISTIGKTFTLSIVYWFVAIFSVIIILIFRTWIIFAHILFELRKISDRNE